MKLRLTLPTRRVVELHLAGPSAFGDGARAEDAAERPPSSARPEATVLAGALEAFADGRASLVERDEPVAVDELALVDFHVLAAVLAQLGVVEEPETRWPCHNCDAELRVRPCARLEIAPWKNGEIDDEELDALAPFDEPLAIAPLRLGRVRSARSVRFAPRTVAQARLLFRATPAAEFDAAGVTAAGLVALGPLAEADAIARALAEADAERWLSVQDAFVATHYPARLSASFVCPSCGARNDVDAPYDRELGPPWVTVPEAQDGERRGGVDDTDEDTHPTQDFVSLEAFTARAHAIAGELLPRVPGDPQVIVIVEDGVPDVDEGGNPLLGSYLPPPPAPTVTVYYRTFARAWAEDEGFDWDAELVETLEHELEHHVYFLRGNDPMDDDERALLRDEAARVIGATEVRRRASDELRQSVPDFLRRTWILWVVVALAFALTVFGQR